ncbi:MAG: hypothetical protein ACM3QW_00825 [Ignavibacteriales bacterium]
MSFLVCALGIAAGILLLPVLWDIKKVVGGLRSLLETNQEFIQKTIRTMPGILENAGQISSNVRDTTDKLRISIPVILLETECVTHAAKESVEMASAAIDNVSSGVIDTVALFKKDTSDYTAYFHIIMDIVQTIYRAFSSSK